VTLDLEDAKAIWGMLDSIKQTTTINSNNNSNNGNGNGNPLRNCAPEVQRSVAHLTRLTEDIVRSLIPFDGEFIIMILFL